VFESETRPLIDHYQNRGVLREVAADLPADDVTEAILAVL
jgi:adenylate kinase family enzyme